MIKKIFLVTLALVFLTGVSSANVHAQIQDEVFAEESIASFDAHIKVNTDNSVDVTESIVYNTGPNERHGIYRDVYPYSSQNRKMSIERVAVTDESGNSYPFTLSDSATNFRIKIGDPNTTFVGQKTYVIKYHATRAVAQFSDLDEIYWNVTGNEWQMPIYQVRTSIVLPGTTESIQSACYFGPKGSTDQCGSARVLDNAYTFDVPFALDAEEGVTVAVGFPKNVVSAYTTSDNVNDFFYAYRSWFVAILAPLITLILSLLYWYRKGRDPRSTGVIVPQYDVLDNLTPMEVAGIVNQNVNSDSVSAEIIYLATKGYLTIRQLEDSFIDLVKRTDYELTLHKTAADLPNDFDQKLVRGLFQFATQPNGQPSTSPDGAVSVTAPFNAVKLSSLKYVFHKNTVSVIKSALDALLNKGYYKNLGRMKSSGRIAGFIFVAIWGSGFFAVIAGGLLGVSIISLVMSVLASVFVYAVVSHFSPAKTEKGVVAKEHLLGLRDYLQIAEKDRLKFHNAPEKKPEVFERLLPYAMVLGVADIWAKEFEGIYTTPPSWYSGPSGTTFSTVAFSHSLSNFSTYANSTMGSSSSSSSSGSGGGGSSGGGGGGGGGGGW